MMTISIRTTLDRVLRNLFHAIILSVTFVGLANAAEPINTLERSGVFKHEPSGIAIRGYDTVAYFTIGEATLGSDEFTTEWEGATWKFSSQEHLDLFVASPEKYAPQYGGYCAYGVAVDSLVKIEGENWDVIDDKLYLNYNARIQNKWRKKAEGYIETADGKFAQLLLEEE